MDKIKRLEVYAEGLRNRLKGELSTPKREFLERDLRKTLFILEGLKK